MSLAGQTSMCTKYRAEDIYILLSLPIDLPGGLNAQLPS